MGYQHCHYAYPVQSTRWLHSISISVPAVTSCISLAITLTVNQFIPHHQCTVYDVAVEWNGTEMVVVWNWSGTFITHAYSSDFREAWLTLCQLRRTMYVNTNDTVPSVRKAKE